MCDPCLVPETRKRIDNRDYEAVFAHGGCFHFALRLHERFTYTIRGIRASPDGNSLSHVWCLKTDTCKGIDVRGFYEEDVIVQLAGAKGADKLSVSADEVRAVIAAKCYPADLDKEMRDLADWVFDTHERFLLAKPSSPGLYEQFCKNYVEPPN